MQFAKTFAFAQLSGCSPWPGLEGEKKIWKKMKTVAQKRNQWDDVAKLKSVAVWLSWQTATLAIELKAGARREAMSSTARFRHCCD